MDVSAKRTSESTRAGQMVSLIESLISADVLSRKRAAGRQRNDLTRLPFVTSYATVAAATVAYDSDKKSRRARAEYAARKRTRMLFRLAATIGVRAWQLSLEIYIP